MPTSFTIDYVTLTSEEPQKFYGAASKIEPTVEYFNLADGSKQRGFILFNDPTTATPSLYYIDLRNTHALRLFTSIDYKNPNTKKDLDNIFGDQPKILDNTQCEWLARAINPLSLSRSLRGFLQQKYTFEVDYAADSEAMAKCSKQVKYLNECFALREKNTVRYSTELKLSLQENVRLVKRGGDKFCNTMRYTNIGNQPAADIILENSITFYLPSYRDKVTAELIQNTPFTVPNSIATNPRYREFISGLFDLLTDSRIRVKFFEKATSSEEWKKQLLGIYRVRKDNTALRFSDLVIEKDPSAIEIYWLMNDSNPKVATLFDFDEVSGINIITNKIEQITHKKWSELMEEKKTQVTSEAAAAQSAAAKPQTTETNEVTQNFSSKLII